MCQRWTERDEGASSALGGRGSLFFVSTDMDLKVLKCVSHSGVPVHSGREETAIPGAPPRSRGTPCSPDSLTERRGYADAMNTTTPEQGGLSPLPRDKQAPRGLRTWCRLRSVPRGRLVAGQTSPRTEKQVTVAKASRLRRHRHRVQLPGVGPGLLRKQTRQL